MRDVESGSDSESSPNCGQRTKRTEKKQRKKAKKRRINNNNRECNDRPYEKLIEMQNSQMKIMENVKKRTEDLLLKFETDQRKLNEESRKRQQKFLRITEIMTK